MPEAFDRLPKTRAAIELEADLARAGRDPNHLNVRAVAISELIDRIVTSGLLNDAEAGFLEKLSAAVSTLTLAGRDLFEEAAALVTKAEERHERHGAPDFDKLTELFSSRTLAPMTQDAALAAFFNDAGDPDGGDRAIELAYSKRIAAQATVMDAYLSCKGMVPALVDYFIATTPPGEKCSINEACARTHELLGRGGDWVTTRQQYYRERDRSS